MAEELQSPNIRRTESGYRIELSPLRSACQDAMIIIGQSQSFDQYNANINAAVASVDAMEDHLAPYWDTPYENDRLGKLINNKKDERDGTGFETITFPIPKDIKREFPDIDEEKINNKIDEIRLDILRKQLREKIRALIKLQDRKNLLLEEETEDYAGED